MKASFLLQNFSYANIALLMSSAGNVTLSAAEAEKVRLFLLQGLKL
jgi:hypothetical protein